MSNNSQRKPVIGIACDVRILTPSDFHMVGGKYIRAVVETMDAVPFLIPALGSQLPMADTLAAIDGLVLPGAYANVDPALYGKSLEDPDCWLDRDRDATAMPLVKLAIEKNVPVFGICRGFQEINVALGGTLHQFVHNQPGLNDHREDKDASLEAQYADSHAINLTAGGWLHSLAGKAQVQVNSLHMQGIDELAPGLVAEACAEDGLVEAYRLDQEDRFLLAAQWHPEWQVATNPFNKGLYQLFLQAVQQRMA